MVNYIIRRILIAIPVLFGVTVISFLIVNMAPGSPLDMIVDPNISEADIAARKAALGLNAPLYIQYWHWLANMMQGNLGYSLTTYRPVAEIIGERIGPTVLLMGSSLAIGLLISLPLGILSATRQYSRLDYFCTAGSLFGISVPTFFLGLSLIYIFSLVLKWLPSSGMVTLGTGGDVLDRLEHLIMPAMVLGAFFAGKMIRYVRSCMLEILDQDYLRTARAKGVREAVVINRHALRNGLIPIVTVVGLEVAALLGGAVITEQIFSWPGLGQLTMESVLSRDYSTLMGLNLLAAVVVLTVNLLTDIIYSLVDPRIRYE
jgi:ABC-type dipeptide/oligopeptide/nickel transport systems, permease components